MDAPSLPRPAMMLLERTLIEVFVLFHQNSILDVDKIVLPLPRFNELVQEELPHLMKNAENVEKKLKSMEGNDKKLEFGEYWQLLGEVVQENKREELGRKK